MLTVKKNEAGKCLPPDGLMDPSQSLHLQPERNLKFSRGLHKQ